MLAGAVLPSCKSGGNNIAYGKEREQCGFCAAQQPCMNVEELYLPAFLGVPAIAERILPGTVIRPARIV